MPLLDVAGVRSRDPELRGAYPTPIEELAQLSTKKTTFWVKRDDLTHPVYGGNKIRKLEHLLRDARARGKRRVLTVGAAGSHHVLATALFGRAAGLEVVAVLVPQRETPHVRETLRASLASGVTPIAARSYAEAAARALAWVGRDTYTVTLGGSSVLGSQGYVEAALELERQVRAGVCAEPDRVVVAVGSGGTAAGLAAGLAKTSLKTRVLGVIVGAPAFVVQTLARRLARKLGSAERLDLDARFLGAGYGEPTPEGERASAIASRFGLGLDATYTAKTFAAFLERGERNVLFWHTLSSAPMEPLLTGAPEIPRELEPLLR